MDQARGDDLDEEGRAQRGFVQGKMDEPMLARFQAGPGVFVARDGEAIAGSCMTSLPGMVEGGPPAKLVEAVTRARPGVPLDRTFLLGPVAVDRAYQGRGLLTRLLVRVCAELEDRFELGAAFVESVNEKSLAIHRHYPMEESTGFTFNGRGYVVFTFSPRKVVDHYR